MRLLGGELAVDRRAALLQCALAFGLTPLVPTRPVHAISATTMTGKTKPDLGVFLIEEPTLTGGTMSANLVVSGGLIATATFDTKWPLAEGGYYDIEAKNREGDAAYIQVGTLDAGESLAKLKASWFTKRICSVEGRYGAYGAPTDIKMIADEADGAARKLELSFTTLSPGMLESSRHALVTAMQPAGSSDVLMIVASASVTRWKKAGAEAAARQATSSFRIASTRPTALSPTPSADYRFGKSSGPENMKSRNDGF